MKVSVIISIFILAIGLGLGWQNHQRLASADTTHKQLLAEAVETGNTGLVTKHARENPIARGKLEATKIIELAKAMDALPENPAGEDLEHMHKLHDDSEILMLSLDATGLRILIASVREDKKLSKKSRESLIFFSLRNLALDHPQEVLKMIASTPDLAVSETFGDAAIDTALGIWAREDPLAALEWFHKNRGNFSNLDPTDRILIGTATHDPRLAFRLIRELNVKVRVETIRTILDTASSPEERTAVCSALRDHLTTMSAGEERDEITVTAFRAFAGSAHDGFASASRWIASINFTPDELESLADGLLYSPPEKEKGRWIEWLGTNLPAGKYEKRVDQMMKRWADEDFRAAGDWLGHTPDSPVKTIATQSYATAVSRCDPEAAAQWALTLHPGQKRDETLKYIHRNWPKDAPEAAAVFAKEHGIH